MAERPSGAGERRDRRLEDAESEALGGAPRPKPAPLPEAKPSGFLDTARKALEGLGVRHNVNGKQQDKAP